VRTDITKRARTYGYFIWQKHQDPEILTLVGGVTEILNVHLGERFLGQKHIDWKYRRISLGYKHTRALPATAREFNATKMKDGSLLIRWK
jgi:hypothetical protein